MFSLLGRRKRGAPLDGISSSSHTDGLRAPTFPDLSIIRGDDWSTSAARFQKCSGLVGAIAPVFTDISRATARLVKNLADLVGSTTLTSAQADPGADASAGDDATTLAGEERLSGEDGEDGEDGSIFGFDDRTQGPQKRSRAAATGADL